MPPITKMKVATKTRTVVAVAAIGLLAFAAYGFGFGFPVKQKSATRTPSKAQQRAFCKKAGEQAGAYGCCGGLYKNLDGACVVKTSGCALGSGEKPEQYTDGCCSGAEQVSGGHCFYPGCAPHGKNPGEYGDSEQGFYQCCPGTGNIGGVCATVYSTCAPIQLALAADSPDDVAVPAVEQLLAKFTFTNPSSNAASSTCAAMNLKKFTITSNFPPGSKMMLYSDAVDPSNGVGSATIISGFGEFYTSSTVSVQVGVPRNILVTANTTAFPPGTTTTIFAANMTFKDQMFKTLYKSLFPYVSSDPSSN